MSAHRGAREEGSEMSPQESCGAEMWPNHQNSGKVTEAWDGEAENRDGAAQSILQWLLGKVM